MKHFPAAWLKRLNKLVADISRQRGWGDVRAVVVPPTLPDSPPTLRLEKGATLEIIPLSLNAVRQLMTTGQSSPLQIEIKHAFFRVLKIERRRAQQRPGRGGALAPSP